MEGRGALEASYGRRLGGGGPANSSWVLSLCVVRVLAWVWLVAGLLICTLAISRA
mgnify:CR=1 FL=1